jgi:hypothetical protein
MRTIKDIFNLRAVQGDVGVEIEVEGCDLPNEVNHWKAVGDGSLKGEENVEYVLYRPVPIDDLRGRLDILKKAFEDNNSEFDETYRAGVHVHVNVQELNVRQLFTFVTTYLVVEELLLTFCAKHRVGNHFCLRASEAGYLPQLIWKAIEQQDLGILYTDDIRYSSINLKPLAKYGSVEFRALESTYNFDKIDTWAKILYQLRQASLEFECPRKIMEEVSVGGYEGFVRKVFGKYADQFLDKPHWDKMVRKGILVAQDIAYSRDWGKLNLNIFSKQGDW